MFFTFVGFDENFGNFETKTKPVLLLWGEGVKMEEGLSDD